jgi:hypothetical protein
MDRLFTHDEVVMLEFTVSKFIDAFYEIQSVSKNQIFKFIIFLVHFSFSIFLMDWYVKENRCELLSNRANYFKATTYDGAITRNLLPMMAEKNNTAYTYTSGLDAVFSNTEKQCHLNATQENRIHLHPVAQFDATSPLCIFRGVMPAIEASYLKDDYTLGGVNNMVFLMLLFEWITASFALDYLADTTNIPEVAIVYNLVSLCWNLCLFVFSFAYVTKLPFNNMTMGWALSLIAMLRQSFHLYNSIVTEEDEYTILNVIFGEKDNQLNKITTRYFEYAITAPVLLISVQSIVAQSDGWTYPVAYVCMVVTNLLGIPLHKASTADFDSAEYVSGYGTDDENKPVYGGRDDILPEVDNRSKANKPFRSTRKMVSAVAKAAIQAVKANNAVTILMTLLVSWLAFATSWVVYLNEIGLFFSRFPNEIKALVLILPLGFASFGVVGTWLSVQAALGYKEAAKKTLDYMDYVYDILSLAVKIFVVLIVFTSNEFRPNSGCQI